MKLFLAIASLALIGMASCNTAKSPAQLVDKATSEMLDGYDELGKMDDEVLADKEKSAEKHFDQATVYLAQAELSYHDQPAVSEPRRGLDSLEKNTDINTLLQERGSRQRQGYIDGEEGYMFGGIFGEAHDQFMRDYERFVPDIAIWGGAQNSTGLSGEAGDFSFWEIGTGHEGKIASGADTFVAYGGLLNIREYDFDPATGIADMALYALFIDMGGGRFINDDLLIEGHFQPGLATDFGGTITSSHWKWFGELVLTYRGNESVYWKFGGRADDTLEDTPAYPVLGVSWLFDPKWRLDVLAPRYAEVAFSPTESVTFRGGLSLQGLEYGYHRTTGAGGTENSLTARTQELRAYIDGVWNLDELRSISARIGGTFAGDYDIERPAGAGSYDGTVETAFFFEVNLGVSF